MDGTLGEIRIYAGNIVPNNWMICDGREMGNQTHRALFNVIGFEYGQVGTTNFRIPDLRTKVPMGAGQGKNLTNRSPGQKGGTARNTLEVKNLPPIAAMVSSSHATLDVAAEGVSIATPGQNVGRTFESSFGYNKQKPDVTLNAGGNAAEQISNKQAFLTIQYIICVIGASPITS